MSVGAVLDGKTDIAIGNVVGSNIFNVLFILGLSALITPLVVNVQLIRQEVPIMIGASLLLLALALDGRLGLRRRRAAVRAAAGLHRVPGAAVARRDAGGARRVRRRGPRPARQAPGIARLPVQMALIVVGLGLLVLGSDWLVSAAIVFAKALGVSDLVIGLTIVAAGTSMPEVATSITAAIKGERDIAVGNVVGSNTFNILGCLGISGLVAGPTGLVDRAVGAELRPAG